MKNKISISIPQPCHENWQNMTVSEKGKFCDSCQKNVIDFTKATDREIINALNKNNHLCGRFEVSQLQRTLVIPKEKSSLWIVAIAGVLGFLGLGSHTLTAQEKTEIVQNLHKKIRKSPNHFREISGLVTYTDLPLQDVTVTVKKTKRSAFTDLNGQFSIKANPGETLVFSYNSMKEHEIIIGQNQEYFVKMEYAYSEPEAIIKSYEMIPHRVTTGAVRIIVSESVETVKTKRTFLGRIFHTIGNLFK